MKRLSAFFLFFLIGISMNALAVQDDTFCCEEGSEVNSYTDTRYYECCNCESQQFTTKELLQDMLTVVPELCAAHYGCHTYAIGRICVEYLVDDDGQCYVQITIYYYCCCCVAFSNPDLPNCDFNFSSEGCDIDEIFSETEYIDYECCDLDGRRQAICDASFAAFDRAINQCADNAGCDPNDTRVHGYQVDFGPQDDECRRCTVRSTIFYSCCCPCVF